MNEIELNQIDFSYGRHLVLEKIDFKISSGEFILLVGENGSGKTTLLKILAGLLFPTKGKVLRSQNFSTNLHLPQVSLYPELSLRENFDFYSRLYQTHSDDLSHLIDLFKLKKFLYKPVEELSFGQRIRGDLVRTFMKESSLYILDEPFTGLDTDSQEILKSYMKLKLEEGKSIIISSHQPAIVDEFQGRLVSLN